MARRELLEIRVGEEEKRRWRLAAEAAGLSLSAWVRWALGRVAEAAMEERVDV